MWKDNPFLNVGIFLGPVSNVVRIDVDGAVGEAKLTKLCKAPPITWEFSSGGGGRGLLFKIPHGIILRTTSLQGDGIHEELRFQAKGAQTVLPPSRHISGRRYAWLPGRGPSEIEAATLPPALVELMQEKPVGPKPHGAGGPTKRTFVVGAPGDDRAKAKRGLRRANE